MVDIHSHIIPFIDDGSKTMEGSIALIEEAIKQGITDIICTPHYRPKMFEVDHEKTEKTFFQLQDATKDKNIRLYLGQEIYCKRIDSLLEILQNKKVFTMNNTNYLLLEFPYTDYVDISEIVYVMSIRKYQPIVAHIERYEYVKITDIQEIRKNGGLIQVNSSSIVGKDGHKIKNYVLDLIKKGLVDFISSDIHEKRKNYMGKAYRLIEKKFGKKESQRLFYDEALRIIGK